MLLVLVALLAPFERLSQATALLCAGMLGLPLVRTLVILRERKVPLRAAD
jgi:hypothetical protein